MHILTDNCSSFRASSGEGAAQALQKLSDEAGLSHLGIRMQQIFFSNLYLSIFVLLTTNAFS